MKPDWLKIRPPNTIQFSELKSKIKILNLHTVCEEAHCPNMAECWSERTATFMVLGDTCTRGCRFCAVKSAGKGQPIDEEEPRKIAEFVKEFNWNYLVLTSVDRDDLPDQGAGHFAQCITEIKKLNPTPLVEVLIPDFRGNQQCIQTIVDASPDVIAHNIETVPRLQGKIRDARANFQQSLFVLETVKKLNPKVFTKSSIMLGLGEEKEEVIESMKQLRGINVDFFTLGQYLQPEKEFYFPLQNYVHPNEFEEFKMIAYKLGFKFCASGPLVRSSYKAAEPFIQKIVLGE